MCSTQSASSTTSASTSSVAVTPVFAPVPASSPASTPTLSGPNTRTPTTSRSGCASDARSDRRPMLPVAHCMTRYGTRIPPDRLGIVSGPSAPARGAHDNVETAEFRTGLVRWLDEHLTELEPPYVGEGTLGEQMEQLSRVKRALFDAGWMRWGWPESVGGLGGPPMLRAVLGEEVTGRDLVVPGFFSMTEILAPTLAEFAAPALAREEIPKLLQRRGDVVPGLLGARHRERPVIVVLPRRANATVIGS